MGGLAHFLEDEGLSTTQISLIRPQTENTRPPRALWVPFELGRPLGVPNNAAFQKQVLRAVLALLEREDGPVILDDFKEAAPATDEDQSTEGWFCPISLPSSPTDKDAVDDFQTAIDAEVAILAPWYDLARRKHGRTSMGLSGMAIGQITSFICEFLDGGVPENPNEDQSIGQTLKFVVEDIKVFYRESASAQPGQNTGKEMNDWFYGETAAGRALYALRPILKNLSVELKDDFLRIFSDLLLIPASQKYRNKKDV